MRVYDLIQKKKNGEELTPAELDFLVRGYTDGTIPDYQMSAFAMAVYFQSMTPAETAALTDAMARSGDTVDLSWAAGAALSTPGPPPLYFSPEDLSPPAASYILLFVIGLPS